MQTKANIFREQSMAEIEKSIQEKRGELQRLRADAITRETKNYRAGNTLRKEVARLLTILREKQCESELV